MLRRLNDRQLRDCKKTLGKLCYGTVFPHVITRAVYHRHFAHARVYVRIYMYSPEKKGFASIFRAFRAKRQRGEGD